MLKAVIFDFDGVIADTEPVHLKAFQLTEIGAYRSPRRSITRIISLMMTRPFSGGFLKTGDMSTTIR